MKTPVKITNGADCRRCDMDAEKLAMQKRIDNLCEQLEIVKRQRDAAVNAIKFHKSCVDCKHSTIIPDGDEIWIDCPKRDGRCCGHSLWEWRGLCKENGGVEDA